MTYDFRAARDRIQQLRNLWLTACKSGDVLTQAAITYEIAELEQEIASAHKKAAAANSGDTKIFDMVMLAHSKGGWKYERRL